MTDPAAILQAGADADEAAAWGDLRKAGPDAPAFNWTAVDPIRQPGRIEDGTGEVVVYDEGSPTAAQAVHMARHDPARALRTAAAIRKVAGMWQKADAKRDYNALNQDLAWQLDAVLEALAEIYQEEPCDAPPPP